MPAKNKKPKAKTKKQSSPKRKEEVVSGEKSPPEVASEEKEESTEHTVGTISSTESQPAAQQPKEEPQDSQKKKKKKKRGTGRVAKFFKSLNYIGTGKLRSAFLENLATMMDAGLPVVDALKTLLLEMRNRTMRKLVASIVASVENGSPLWRAMEDEVFFSPYEIALIRVGEEAGNLSRNMQYLVEQNEKNRELKAKVKMAMIYPIVVITLMFVVVVGLGMFVLPNLIQVLLSLNAKLPFATLMLIEATNLFSAHGHIFVPILIGIFILLFLLSKYTRFKVVTQWIVLRLPGIGPLARQATIARFGVILGGLLQAGVPLIDAMESLVDATQMAAYRSLYVRMVERVRLGDSFSKAFEVLGRRSKVLPASVRQLVATGERSGKLSEILLKIGSIYEKKASETAQKLPVILEPTLLLLIAGLVGGIAFAIITPIYSVVGNVGR